MIKLNESKQTAVLQTKKKDKFGTCYVQHMTFVLKLDKARYLSIYYPETRNATS